MADRTATGSRRSSAGRKPAKAAGVVAVVAILAGVGVVGLRPPSAEPVRLGARASAEVRDICTRVVEITFNPRTQRGSKIAKVAFRFTYRIRPSQRDEARRCIELEWNRLVSRSVEVLMQRTPRELKDAGGLEATERDLARAIDAVVFQDRAGRVEEILWQQIVVQ